MAAGTVGQKNIQRHRQPNNWMIRKALGLIPDHTVADVAAQYPALGSNDDMHNDDRLIMMAG